MNNVKTMPGVSGISLYVPRLRVRLADWCAWSGAPSDKVEAVVGRSFRVCAPNENVYTMAANAVLRLIDNYDIDPREVGFLGFGTESSTDNAAGAVIIRGMLDQQLIARGRPTLSRDCEVPEFKHACLGGVYALKSANRYLATDGRARKAIVVSGDIAEYERGSSGEQTQGAGAVAMLLESTPQLFALDLDRAGSSSAYRGVDFRKPFARHFLDGYASKTNRFHDFPVFNGKYSTICYLEAIVSAIDAMFARIGGSRQAFFDDLGAVFCHRPYQHMPIQAVATALVWSILREPGAHPELNDVCQAADVSIERLQSEINSAPNLFELVAAKGVDVDPFPALMAVVRKFRGSAPFRKFTADKLALGDDMVRDLGNLYTAALPAWIGAAFEDAVHSDIDLDGRTLLALGYGSGDAAEAIPLRVGSDWREAASRIRMRDALANATDLRREQYEALHDRGAAHGLPDTDGGFVIAEVGRRNDAEFADIGIDYYAFAP